MVVSRNDKTRVSANFIASEFYSKSIDAPVKHYIDDRLINAVQIVRDYFDVPIQITSSFRTTKHQNLLVGQGIGASKSEHPKGKAIDFQFKKDSAKILDSIEYDFDNRGPLFKVLRKAGINGFGVYDSFIHLDTRSENFTQGLSDSYGDYQYWNKKKIYFQ